MDHYCIDRRIVVGISCSHCQASAIAVAVALHPPVATCTQGSAHTFLDRPAPSGLGLLLGLSLTP